jgi:hypothetical protein
MISHITLSPLRERAGVRGMGFKIGSAVYLIRSASQNRHQQSVIAVDNCKFEL